MKPRTIRGRAFIGGAFADDVTITFDRRILAIDPGGSANAERVDGAIVPGFIDLHVHGGGGADFMDGSVEAATAVTRFHARGGTTTLGATTLSASHRDILRAVNSVIAMRHNQPHDSAEIGAINFEGPYISPARPGAQDPGSIRTPDIAEVEEMITAASGLPVIMTVAPEIDGIHALLERLRDEAVVAIGHTNATFGEALDGITRGARHVTHLFNAMPPLHHREPGVVGAALLSDEITVELIADGLHLHPAVLQYFARAMEGRCCLVTDAMRACGMTHGTYRLYQHEVTVDETGARLADGTLAGSVLTMIRAVQNTVELAGLPLEMVLPMATTTPARIIGIDGRKGKIETGFDADLLVINERLEIERLFVRGREIDAT